MSVDQLRIATAKPSRCHLYGALGYDEPCPGIGCAFFRVPGIEGCAIEQWDPGVEGHEGRAAWFLTRRLEAEETQRRREEQFGLDAPHPHPSVGLEATDVMAARPDQEGSHG